MKKIKRQKWGTKMEEVLAEFSRMEKSLHKTAWSFQRTTGGDIEEIFAEASRWFMHAIRTAKKKGKKARYVWVRRIALRGLSDWSRELKRHRALLQEIDPVALDLYIDTRQDFNPRTSIEWGEWRESLSREAQEVVRILLETPEVLQLEGHETAKEIRGKIKGYLRENQGWTWASIWGSFREIKTALA